MINGENCIIKPYLWNKDLMVKNFVKKKMSRLMQEVQTAIHLFYYNLFDVMDWKLIMMSCKVSNV